MRTALCLLSTMLSTSAQQPVAAEQERAGARLAWLHGVVRPAEVRVDYGPAAWRERYEAEVDARSARSFPLGSGGWAALHTTADVVVGKRRLPAGVWYLALQRSAEAKWSLAVLESAKVLRHGILPGNVADIEPALRLPLRHRRSERRDRLRVRLDGGASPGGFVILLGWGEHEMLAELAVDVEVAAAPAEPPKFRNLDPARAVETASGLRYELLRDGVGRAPGPTGKVRVHYVGWTADGRQFDSSLQRGQVAAFGVSQVIAGWQEGLQLMSPGAVFLFEIPPELGYGARGAGDAIPPDATLWFWVELLAVE